MLKGKHTGTWTQRTTIPVVGVSIHFSRAIGPGLRISTKRTADPEHGRSTSLPLISIFRELGFPGSAVPQGRVALMKQTLFSGYS